MGEKQKVTEADYKGPSEFVHLHSHTLYSMLDGVASPEQYAEECYKRKYPAMAVTEHGHMASVPDMYMAFKKHKLKAIPGCEIYLNDYEPLRQKLLLDGIKIRSPDWKKSNIDLYNRIVRNRHLTVLCKNETGFNNLIKLTTQAYETGLFGTGRTKYNRVWFDKLCEFKEGLIILSGCLNGPVSHELRHTYIEEKTDKLDETGKPIKRVVWERTKQQAQLAAFDEIKKYKKIFGENYYIELQMPGVKGDLEVFHNLIKIADFFKIKTVLANDSHYMTRRDHELQTIMMAIAQETTIDSEDLFHSNSSEQYFKTRAELWERFKNGNDRQSDDEPSDKTYSDGVPDSVFEAMCDNTLEIADKCEFIKHNTESKIPSVTDADSILQNEVSSKLKELGLYSSNKEYLIDGKNVTYKKQAEIELQRFIEKGFAGYFLITQDLIKYGKSRGWPFMPRGSASGSLVCYLLGITNYDPLPWGLSFDRFLSPARGGYMLKVTME